MRVVIVSDFGSVNGGAAKVAIESARGLAEAGAAVVFACAIAPVSERLSHPNVSVETFGADEVWNVGGRLAAARQGVWNAAAHAWLTALLSRQPREETVVHLHQWTKAFSPAAIAAAGESGLPVVVTMHDYFAFCPAGGYFDFQKGATCDKTPMGAACIGANCDRASYLHKLVRVARQWRSDRALAACGHLTFAHVSAFARRFAQPFLPPHARHAVVDNMIDVDKRPPVDVRRNRGALFLGRLTHEKGPHLAAAAARAVGMPVRFVGEGPMREAILRANPEAELRGWLGPQDVEAEIAAARVLVAPSIWFETGPLVTAEARAMGVPVILSRDTGAAASVRHEVDGYLVAPGDVGGVERALRLLQSDDLAQHVGAAAYDAYWSEPLTTARHVAATLRVYAGALGFSTDLDAAKTAGAAVFAAARPDAA